MSKQSIAFIGGGNMAASIIGGLINSGRDAAGIRVSDPVIESHARLKALGDVRCSTDNMTAVDGSDIIVLAVKPQVMAEAAASISDYVRPARPLIISIAAGIPVSALQRWLGEDTPIVRCMPNTPALIGEGAAALFGDNRVSTAHKAAAEEILRAAGTALWVDQESQLDAVTALSGSGPAYYFHLMEVMTEIGVELGLSRQQSSELTLQTARGAAAMACSSDVDVAELRRRVTSPGGTTEAALKAMADADFSGLMRSALTAARDRSLSLADEWSAD